MAARGLPHVFCTHINHQTAVRPVAVGRLLLLRLIRDVLHHVLHSAIQDSAKHVDGVGADEFVALQAGDLAWTDMVFIDKGVLRHISVAHGFP